MPVLVRPLIGMVIVLLMSTSLLSSDAPLTNKDVISLSQLGIGDAAVIAKIRQAPRISFRLEVDDLAALKKAGVSGPVIAAMLDRTAADANAASSGSGALSGKEPDYLGNFCWRSPSTGELTPLERQTGTSAVSVIAMGFGGGEGYMRVSGDRSPVRFKEGDPTDFVVLVSSHNVDPQQVAKLFVLDVVDGERRLPVARAASMGFGGRSVITENQVAIRAIKYGKSSFLITSTEPLGPGEYAFAGPVEGVGFCFGVDANPGSGVSRFERLVPYRQREVIPLGISERGMTVHSVEVIRWPKDDAMRRIETKPDAKGEILVVFSQSNRAGRDFKCTYDVVLLDDSGKQIGVGKRTVGIEDGEIDDTARVGISVRLADVNKAAKLRVRAVPAPDL